MIGHRLVALLVLVGAGPAVAAASVRVVVPDVEWSVLVPYVAGNVHVEYGDGIHFGTISNAFVEQGRDDDRQLNELAKVLITESLVRDREVRDAVRQVSKAIELSRPEAERHRSPENDALYWQRLQDGGRYVPALQRFFERARQAGTLRCSACVDHGDHRQMKIEALSIAHE
jgi:hypothetical protein